MSLQSQVMTQLKAAMKAKDAIALESLRAIKSAILVERTASGTKQELTEDDELRLLQKLVKQRKESAEMYTQQGRNDLVEPELAQAEVIASFLPAQLSEEEVEAEIAAIISQTGASSMKDMGKVMGIASKNLAGKADGKTISMLVKQKLS